MNSSSLTRLATLALLAAAPACASRVTTTAAPVPIAVPSPAPASPLADARQLVIVTTPAWDSTSGTLRRYERDAAGQAWRGVGAPVAIVVGRTGLAWDDALSFAAAGEPIKREGDGKSPAGAFALDTAFGFSIRQILPWVRLPYLQLRYTTECVDDARSAHYNTIVDRERVSNVDWSSSEKMRVIDQYAFGVHVAYNANPPRSGRGSCIFLHIWGGPSSVTAGCTAMEASALESLLRWLAPERRPMLVQLPASALARARGAWALPE
jgi:L,D-peptidoglycan transpeptidase YkuD (ErfK/YbiS/YcfS/YnhG family)